MLAMRRLVAERPALKAVRFFGKIFGRSNDYYICEVCRLTGTDVELTGVCESAVRLRTAWPDAFGRAAVCPPLGCRI
jgi:hypothetical protein